MLYFVLHLFKINITRLDNESNTLTNILNVFFFRFTDSPDSIGCRAHFVEVYLPPAGEKHPLQDTLYLTLIMLQQISIKWCRDDLFL